MKKYLRFADAIVLLGGAFGMLLRMWLVLGGTDEKGLYPANHISSILLGIFSIAMVAAIWLMTRQVGNNPSFHSNFPSAIANAAGAAVAALGFAVTGFGMLGAGDALSSICGFLGLLAAAALLLGAWSRYQKKKSHFICHLLPCLFFALRVFAMGRELGAEPEANRYLYRFLASLAVIPACYQLWGFDVNEGDRSKSLFWSLTAAYLCLIATPGSVEWLLYLTVAIWLLASLPVLKYLPRRKRASAPEIVEDQEPAPAEESPVEEKVPFEMPQVPPVPAAPVKEDVPAPTPDAEADFDPDQILTEILREIDSNIQ